MQADAEQILRLLKTARGQIDGIMRMVEADRYCIDISTQLMATQSLLGKTNAEVLKAHVKGCVASAIHTGDNAQQTAKIKEIERVIEKLS
ncbi:metal-sensing transcriptional repressor [Collinsella sp. zg1085]|uniref:metal-sensing transcriptional repressor n=1 Tax=Collinsella sp. zg1085 TaxID=2844380 RepID=UPI001C0CA84B|nr:metal-sensing transcriptional repressor [Collinsella sp. zg1085]QWT17252.1 metal-sensing transcriptional repressor [Collinsella sp. zg1085]